MAEHGQGFRVQHGNGVDAQFSDIQPAAVRRHRHARGIHAAHAFDERRRNEALIRRDFIFPQRDALDHVVVAVGHEQIIAAGCPFCNTMLTDGVKHFSKEGEVAVKDVAELIAEAGEL